MTPIISIITPYYRIATLAALNRAISSVRTQSIAHWEHLIAGDGELDTRVHDLVATLDDPRVRHVTTPVHCGGYGAGVRDWAMRYQARGKYLCFLDYDNIIFPDYIEKNLFALQRKTDARFSICRILHHGPVRRSVGIPPLYLDGIPKLGWIDTLQVVVERTAMMEAGWINPLDYCSDGMTYEALGKRFNYVRVSECLGIHF